MNRPQGLRWDKVVFTDETAFKTGNKKIDEKRQKNITSLRRIQKSKTVGELFAKEENIH